MPVKDELTWLYQLRHDLHNCGESIEQIELFLARIQNEMEEHSVEVVSNNLAQNPELVGEIIVGYQNMLTHLAVLKKETLQEMQQLQKAPTLVNAYVQKEESANFIDRQL